MTSCKLCSRNCTFPSLFCWSVLKGYVHASQVLKGGVVISYALHWQVTSNALQWQVLAGVMMHWAYGSHIVQNVGRFGRSVVVMTQNGPSNLFPVSIWQVTHSICSTSYMRAIRYIHFVFYRATGGFKRCDQHGMFNCERRGQLCHQWQKVVEQWWVINEKCQKDYPFQNSSNSWKWSEDF